MDPARLWFVCKFCKRAFQRKDSLILHKEQFHSYEPEIKTHKHKKKSRHRSRSHNERIAAELKSSKKKVEEPMTPEIEVKNIVITNDVHKRSNGEDRKSCDETFENKEPLDSRIGESTDGAIKSEPSEPFKQSEDVLGKKETDSYLYEPDKNIYVHAEVCVLLERLLPDEIELRKSSASLDDHSQLSASTEGKRTHSDTLPETDKNQELKSPRTKKGQIFSSPSIRTRILPRRSATNTNYTYTQATTVKLEVPRQKRTRKQAERMQRRTKYDSLDVERILGSEKEDSEGLISFIDLTEASPIKIDSRQEDPNIDTSNTPQPQEPGTEKYATMLMDEEVDIIEQSSAPVSVPNTSANLIGDESENLPLACSKCCKELRSAKEKTEHELRCVFFCCKFCRVLCCDRPSLVFHEVLKHAVELESWRKNLSSLSRPPVLTHYTETQASERQSQIQTSVSTKNDGEDLRGRYPDHPKSTEPVNNQSESVKIIHLSEEKIPQTPLSDQNSICDVPGDESPTAEQITSPCLPGNACTFPANQSMKGDLEELVITFESVAKSKSSFVNIQPKPEYESLSCAQDAKELENACLDVNGLYDDDMEIIFSSKQNNSETPSLCNQNVPAKQQCFGNRDQSMDVAIVEQTCDPPSVDPEVEISLPHANNADVQVTASVEIETAISEATLLSTYEPETFMCSLCGKLCGTHEILEKHCDLKHKSFKPFRCKLCSRSFFSRIGRKYHKCKKTALFYKTHRKKIREMKIRYWMQKQVQGKYKYVYKDVVARKSFQGNKKFKILSCKLCDKRFTKTKHRKQLLAAHLSVHRNVKPHLCFMCGHSFTTSWNYHTHMKCVHKLELKYCCRFCPKRFPRLWDATRHEKRTYLQREDQCDQCCRVFDHRCAAKNHKLLQECLSKPVELKLQCVKSQSVNSPTTRKSLRTRRPSTLKYEADRAKDNENQNKSQQLQERSKQVLTSYNASRRRSQKSQRGSNDAHITGVYNDNDDLGKEGVRILRFRLRASSQVKSECLLAKQEPSVSKALSSSPIVKLIPRHSLTYPRISGMKKGVPITSEPTKPCSSIIPEVVSEKTQEAFVTTTKCTRTRGGNLRTHSSPTSEAKPGTVIADLVLKNNGTESVPSSSALTLRRSTRKVQSISQVKVECTQDSYASGPKTMKNKSSSTRSKTNTERVAAVKVEEYEKNDEAGTEVVQEKTLVSRSRRRNSEQFAQKITNDNEPILFESPTRITRSCSRSRLRSTLRELRQGDKPETS